MNAKCEVKGCPGRGTLCAFHDNPATAYPRGFAALNWMLRQKPDRTRRDHDNHHDDNQRGQR